MELSDLVGLHELSGVDTATEELVEKYRTETVDVVRFVLGGKTYRAIEDPDDGYRSYLKNIEVCDDPVTNNFPPQKVLGKMKEDSSYGSSDIIQFVDVVTGKVVMEVGTENSADYYPWCVMNWSPENLSCNSGV